MQEKLPGEQYHPEAVEAFANRGHPIPGQSLTANPDERRPFEGPTDFTDWETALEWVTANLLKEENFKPIVLAIGEGTTITDMAMQMGYVGFREGKWNPDLMLMLMEPFMYLLMALCVKCAINYRIDDEDDRPLFDLEDDVDDEEQTILEKKAKMIAEMTKSKRGEEGSPIPQGVLPTEVVEQLEALPEVNLLDKQEPMQETENPDSLLTRGQ